MEIRYKLFFSSLLIVAVFIAAGFFINTNIMNMDSAQTDLIKATNINENAMHYENGARKVQSGVYLYEHGNKEMGKQSINEGMDNMRQSRNNLKNQLTEPSLLTGLADIERAEEKVVEASNSVLKTIDNSPGNTALIEQNLNTLQARVEALDLKIRSLNDAVSKNAAAAAVKTKQISASTITLVYGAILGTVLLSIILSFAMASTLTRPLRVLTGIANKVSKGSIDEKVEISSKDEIGELAESFKRMIISFKIMNSLLSKKKV